MKTGDKITTIYGEATLIYVSACGGETIYETTLGVFSASEVEA